MKRVKEWLGITSPSAAVIAEADAETRRLVRILNGQGFREYERPQGVRGTKDLPEYRVTDYWDGRDVDEGFTFSRATADAMLAGAVDQAYGAELHVRTDGDWQLIERREPSE
ncbi:hypothetical protein ACS5PJ_14370 [Pseudarthrobacter sp. YS3]|uniref:hypothetical protein n=1 Tax=Pseudarthrobacter sp. YS3 TaxID=3453718 RepID=UPI003EEE0611